jgi:hypothetical protein
VRVIVDLDARGNVPRGHLTDERGVIDPFSGWLELMDRVESTLRRARGGGTSPPSGQEGTGAA